MYSYADMDPEIQSGHIFELLESRDHLTPHVGFPIGGQW